MTNLGQIASNMDSVRLADKAKSVLTLIKSVKIEGPDHKIPFDPKATLFRERSGEVYFFSGEPNGSKNLKKRPEGVEYIQYPEFEEHTYNIHYGKPIFY